MNDRELHKLLPLQGASTARKVGIMGTEKHTEYAVARGNEVISEWSTLVSDANAEQVRIEAAMRAASLEPDVHVVVAEVEVTTKRSRAKAWEPEPAEVIEPGEVSEGAGVTMPASGIWGGPDAPPEEVIAASTEAPIAQEPIAGAAEAVVVNDDKG